MPDIVVDLRESTRTAQKVQRGDAAGGDVRVDELVAGDLLPGWYDGGWWPNGSISVSCGCTP